MNSRAQLEKALSSRLSGIQITNQLSGLSRAKAPPPVLKSHSIVPQKSLKFIPHPPQKGRPVGLQSGTGAEGKSIKPVPPAEPRAKRPSVRKFYDVRKQDGVIDESRICGDGESLENEEYYEKSRCPSWERIPGDGCISDIAEEDEDAEEENDEAEENDDDDDEDGNCDNDFYECDELDEGKVDSDFALNLFLSSCTSNLVSQGLFLPPPTPPPPPPPPPPLNPSLACFREQEEERPWE